MSDLYEVLGAEASADNLRGRFERLEALEAILGRIADGITVQDPSGALVYANDAAAQLIGFASADELMATPVPEIMTRFEMFDRSGDPFPIERLPGRLALRGIETEETIRYRVRETGSDRWSVVTGTPIFDDAGNVRFAVNAFRDVTARIRAEDDLAFIAEAGRALNATLDYEETLRTLADLVVPRLAEWAGFYLVDEEGRVQRLFGAHENQERRALIEEMARRHPFDVSAPTNPVAAALLKGRASLFAEVSDADLAAAANDEEHLAALRLLGFTSAMVVPLETTGRVVGAVTLVRTDQRRRYTTADLRVAEELARRAAVAIENARNYEQAQARARSAQALEFVGDGVLLLDRERVIQLWNPAAEAITGLRAADVVGRAAVEAVPGWSELEPHVPLDGRAETLPLGLGDREVWLSISSVDFGEGTVFAFRDVTGERALERLKSEFIATVSHELRTPLSAIYGAAMTLRRGDPGVVARRDDLLAIIAVEAERLTRTVNDVLWASRLESGTVHLTIEECDPSTLVESVAAAARTRLPENLELAVDAPAGLPLVAADPDRVRQVLMNLLDNAVKYSPDGGTVRVSVEPNGRFLRFAVADEGLGIPAGERERVFEKFYRLDPDLTRGVGGTGLGLYICRELVHRMGGRIAVDANVPQGATVAVELPVAS